MQQPVCHLVLLLFLLAKKGLSRPMGHALWYSLSGDTETFSNHCTKGLHFLNGELRSHRLVFLDWNALKNYYCPVQCTCCNIFCCMVNMVVYGICNMKVLGSNPPPSYQLDFISITLNSIPARSVYNQLVRLLPVGIFNKFMLYLQHLFVCFFVYNANNYHNSTKDINT